MSNSRREFAKNLAALAAFPGLFSSRASEGATGLLLDQEVAQKINPDFDAKSYDFWNDFLGNVAEPVVPSLSRSRGGHAVGANDIQPVFLHYGEEGFKNAAELDASGLIPEGDVNVSLNTSTIRIAPQDLEIFRNLQNAQIRVDVAQKSPILPVIEAMAYTVISGMHSFQTDSKGHSGKSESKGRSKGESAASDTESRSRNGSGGGGSGSIQSVSVDSDAAWQKMQNIILPGGEGRWALNLEAQKKDSIMCKVLQNLVKYGGQFAPMIGLPGIAMTALQSFNTLYGAIHAEPVSIIKSNPLRVFATQESFQNTGSPGAVTGILLKSGTYILMPANRAPGLDKLKDLTVTQGRIVPPKTQAAQLDAAAVDTLQDVTYVTFDIQTSSARLFSSGTSRKSS